MKLRPLNDRVVIKAVEPDEVTKSGIILPGNAEKERSDKGEVVAVGPGRMEDGKLIAMTVKVGDVVLYKGWPDKFKIDDIEYVAISESDILGVIEK